MGVGPRADLRNRATRERVRAAASLPGMTVAELELDLEVFSGPLRPAADARPARGGRPAGGAAGRRRPRLPRPSSRRAASSTSRSRPSSSCSSPRCWSSSRASCCRARTTSCSTSSPARRPRSCWRGCSRPSATAAPPSTCASGWPARRACATAARRCRPQLRRDDSSTCEGGLRPAPAGRGARRAAARCRRAVDLAPPHDARASSVAERLAHLRALLRRGAYDLRRGGARRRPRDGRA